ncbi:fmo1p [Saccharomyces arboricola H-6]|uniref:Fmo1p n=1 Tax=Saccharomyces arboricola (strain H-6 / AS 2.3317 / CBS 10644) TaxID=1160507 RepID=J8Q717_SACAR|nr:fmo1p [Saccharomyces arboricola H-6]
MTVNNKKRLAIIGGGPGGLAAARVFSQSLSNLEIVIFVKDYKIGGVWHYPEQGRDERVMYDHLETNISKELMQFSGFPFDANVPLYPSRKNIWEYLEKYYKTFVSNIDSITTRFSTEVTYLEKKNSLWEITSKNEHGTTKSNFDFVIVASGHYSVPRFPANTTGIDQWLENKSAIHSKDFKNCEFAREKVVIVVGNGSSGQDIANQLTTVSKKVYNSIRELAEYQPKSKLIEIIPTISSVDPKNHSVTLSDERVLQNVDYIVFATGYYYSFPFIDPSIRLDVLGEGLTNDKNSAINLHNLWQHMIYVKDPTLSFILTPQLVIPFPLSELQAAIMVEVFSKNLPITTKFDSSICGSHNFPKGKDLEHYAALQHILDSIPHRIGNFDPVKWDARLTQLRNASYADKQERNLLLTDHAQALKNKKVPYFLPAPHT